MSALGRLGAAIARHPRRTLAVWGIALLVAVALAPVFRANLEGLGYETPGSESAQATEAIVAGGGAAERAGIVASSERPDADGLRAALGAAARVAHAQDGVRDIGQPVVALDARAAVLPFGLDGDTAARQDAAEALQEELAGVAPAGIELGATGTSALFADLIHLEERDLLTAEAVGVPLALAILLFALGAAVAAVLPVVTAIAGLLVTFGLLGAVSLFAGMNVFVENVVSMLGLGAGIDYAMLLVRRWREERSAGDGDEAAMARTLATAGRTVVFSGAAVAVCLLPLVVTGLPFFGETAVGAVTVLIAVVLASTTLLPAVLVLLGDRLERGRLPWRRNGERASGSGRWAAWARRVMARPWPVLVAGLVVLGLCAAPLLQLEVGNDLNASALQEEPSGAALAALQRHLPEVAASDVEVVLRASADVGAAEEALVAGGGFRDVRREPLAGGATLLRAAPTAAVDSKPAMEAVRDLRDRLPSGTVVGGYTAESVDFTDEMEAGTPLVVGLALALCGFVLLVVFRSPVLAIKAIVANLLSLAAAFGLVVLVFQEGLGEDVLAFTSPGYIQSWLPLTLFMVVFGLSMDYEVFMVARMREEWEHVGDTTEAVARGLERTGGVVTSAAAIMVVVFGSFVLSTAPEIKQFGFALAAAVLLDATVVRAAVVPAFMRLAGRWNWWLPNALGRRLPRLGLERE